MRRERGWAVVALSGARGEAVFVDADFELVIGAALIGEWRIKGELVVGLGVCDAFLQEEVHIIVGVQSQAAALGGDDRKGEIAGLNLAGLGDSFEEILIVEGAESVGGAEGIDAVKSDVALQELVGDTNNAGEEFLLLFVVEKNFGAGEKGPAGRNPENDLATGVRGFASGEFTERLQGEVIAILGAVEAAGTAQDAKADIVAVESGAEGVAVGGEVFQKLGAGIGENRQSGGIGKAASIGAEEFVNLTALVGKVGVADVDGIDEDDDLDGSLVARERLEGSDGLRSFCRAE